jgi:2-polyprenyl-3-methyl-5-hydroxy-6-metoxy-1,4-benzoquinol methylase
MNIDSILMKWRPKKMEAKVRRQLQLDPNRNWAADRRAEVMEFFKFSEADLARFETEHDIDSNQFRDERMCAPFENADEMDLNQLTQAYRLASNDYILRLMLAYDRVTQALPLVNLAMKLCSGGKVLDYGCGASDTGLTFALHGFHVSICDIAGGNLDFAAWRYQRRQWPVDVIEASEADYYPDLGKDLDFIAALEILEHLPSPI